MKEEDKTQEVLNTLEKPVVKYVQNLLKRAGVEITKDEAENIVSNVGVSILKRKRILSECRERKESK